MKKRSTAFAMTVALGLSSAVITQEAQAVPAFARQMNMPCSACHFQAFPVLNKFGQNFKASGYTLMGDQAKVEGEHLSIPGNLNASILIKIRYQKTNGTDGGFDPAGSIAYDTMKGQAVGTEIKTQLGAGWNGADKVKTRTTNAGELQFPDEISMLVGGRVSENIGFLMELGLASPASALSFKMPFKVAEFADMKLSIIPYYTDGLGAAYGYELLSTGAVRNIRPMEHRRETSAAQYLNTDGAASGISAVLQHDMFFVNFSKWAPEAAGTHANPTNNYLRVVATPSFGDIDVAVGMQNFSGRAFTQGGTPVAPKATIFDAQVQGNLGIPVGIYFSTGTAPATETRWALSTGTSSLYAGNLGTLDGSSAYTMASGLTGVKIVKEKGVSNTFNTNIRDMKATALTIAAGVIPDSLILFFSYRTADNGTPNGGFELGSFDLTLPDGTVAAAGLPKAARNIDKAMTIGFDYHIAQNVLFHVNHSKRSGNAFAHDASKKWDTGGTYGYVDASGPWAPGGSGDQLTTFMIEAAF